MDDHSHSLKKIASKGTLALGLFQAKAATGAWHKCPDPSKACIQFVMHNQVWQVGNDCKLYDGVLTFYLDGTGEFNAHVESSDTNDTWRIRFGQYDTNDQFVFVLPECAAIIDCWYKKDLGMKDYRYHWHQDFEYPRNLLGHIAKSDWLGSC